VKATNPRSESLRSGVRRGAAYRNRTDDLFITRELHQRKSLSHPASAASTKPTQQGQHDQIEVMYAQNTPTRTRLVVLTFALKDIA